MLITEKIDNFSYMSYDVEILFLQEQGMYMAICSKDGNTHTGKLHDTEFNAKQDAIEFIDLKRIS